MDNLPMSALSEEQRRGQYLADVAQENAERSTRGETALDPNTPENRERWNTAQVNVHESLFPFSDNLITLLFIVASDLTEAQRERTYKFPFSQGNAYHFFYLWSSEDNISGIILYAEKLDKNPSLRVSGHVSSMNRTFIVEDYAEEDFEHWTKDEVTGEQGYVDDERSCFGTWDDTECVWQSRPYRAASWKEEKERE